MTSAPMKLAALVIAAAGCAADPAPSAEVRSVTPDQITPLDDALDDLTITVRYADSDGDLGGGTAEVRDCRASDLIIDTTIPQIVLQPGDAITGTLELHVNDIGDLTPTALPAPCAALGVAPLATGTTVLCVTLVDTAGHRGSGDCTRPIAVLAR
jgi:hypothetical protein